MRVVIVIIAFNRTDALKRLLDSVSRIVSPALECLDLVISIDFSPQQEAVQYKAESIEWRAGKKRIVCRTSRKGLKQHVLLCGDLVKEYDLLLMLEDDLYVSPAIVQYLVEAARFLEAEIDSTAIAGISTYSPRVNETSLFAFEPIDDFCNIYIQLPSSWGQAWTPKMWCRFRNWLVSHDESSLPLLPSNIQRWSDNSWKKLFTVYMIETQSYIFYPCVSYSTNFGDSGIHMHSNEDFQVPLSMTFASKTFGSLTESAVYDSFMDISPDYLKSTASELKDIDFQVNLSGDKRVDIDTWEVSYYRREIVKASWTSCMRPVELGVLNGVNGSGVYLTKGAMRLELMTLICFFRNLEIWRFRGVVRRFFLLIRNVFISRWRYY